MTTNDDGTRPDEWIRLQERACKALRSKIGTPKARAAIDWFNTEYSEAEVRARREAVTSAPTDAIHRQSARQIQGVDPGRPTEVWRLSASLIDLRNLNLSIGFQSWEDDSERWCNAFMVLLVVALVADRKAHQYLGKDIELAQLSIGGEGEQLGRGFASDSAGFDEGEEPWPTLVRGAIEEVESIPNARSLPASEAAQFPAPPHGADKSVGPALTADHESIMAVLAKSPMKCKTVIEVSSAGTIRNRETVGRLLRELETLGMVYRPYGKRKGYALTDLGRKRLPGASPT